MLRQVVCVLVIFSEVRGQLNLLGINLPLDLSLGGNKGTTKRGGHTLQSTTPRITTVPTTLLTTKKSTCQPSITLYPSGEAVRCQNRLIYEDNFDGATINKNKWTIEQYTPIISGPAYEFVSYQNSDQNLFIKDGKLFLKPVAFTKDEEVKGILDLREGQHQPKWHTSQNRSGKPIT